jgi:hypothetical protein
VIITLPHFRYNPNLLKATAKYTGQNMGHLKKN